MFKIFILFFIVVQIALLGDTDPFTKKMDYFSNYQQAKNLSMAKYKPMMIVVSTVTCPWCKKFENQTLKKENIDNFIKLHFTPVKLLKDKDSYPKKVLNAKVVPTVFFVDPRSEQILHISTGYKSKKKFLIELQKAKSLYYQEKE